LNFRSSSGLSTTNVRMPKRSAAAMSASDLMGCVWMQRSGSTPAALTSLISPVVATSKHAPTSRSSATTTA
jgi:hypothetical protein